jgi:hypothetical protein
MSTNTLIGGAAATHPTLEFYFISVDLDDGRPCPPVFEVGFCWQIVARGGRKTVWQRHAVTVRS